MTQQAPGTMNFQDVLSQLQRNAPAAQPQAQPMAQPQAAPQGNPQGVYPPPQGNPQGVYPQQAAPPAGLVMPQPQGVPQYAPQAAPQQAPALRPGGMVPVQRYGAGAFSGASVGNASYPAPQPGQYFFEVVNTEMAKRSNTFKANLKILSSTNQNFGPGMTVTMIQTLGDQLQFEIGSGRILQFVLTALGFNDEFTFKQTCGGFTPQPGTQSWSTLIDACCQEPVGEGLWGSNPLAGRKVAAIVDWAYDAAGNIRTVKSGRRKGAQIVNFNFMLAPQAPAAA